MGFFYGPSEKDLIMSAHNMPEELYKASHQMADPGDGGTIAVDRDLATVELVSTGSETRTLDDPPRAGLRLNLRMKTDGGDIVVTADNGLNVTGNTQATFADVGDQLNMIAVSHTSGYRWEILVNTGSVALA